MGRTLPRKDELFIAFARNLADKCIAHKTEWHLDEDTLSHLQSLTGEADAAYVSARNPETSNHHARVSKQVNFLRLRQFLAPFIKMLTTNKAVSEDALEAMGLPSRIHHRRLPLPAPAEAPKLSIHQKQHLEITVGVSVLAHDRPTASLTKRAYYGFAIRYCIEGETEWRVKYSTRLRTTISFNAEDEGKHITLMAAWINPRIQLGPWSSEITSLIN